MFLRGLIVSGVMGLVFVGSAEALELPMPTDTGANISFSPETFEKDIADLWERKDYLNEDLAQLKQDLETAMQPDVQGDFYVVSDSDLNYRSNLRDQISDLEDRLEGTNRLIAGMNSLYKEMFPDAYASRDVRKSSNTGLAFRRFEERE